LGPIGMPRGSQFTKDPRVGCKQRQRQRPFERRRCCVHVHPRSPRKRTTRVVVGTTTPTGSRSGRQQGSRLQQQQRKGGSRCNMQSHAGRHMHSGLIPWACCRWFRRGAKLGGTHDCAPAAPAGAWLCGHKKVDARSSKCGANRAGSRSTQDHVHGGAKGLYSVMLGSSRSLDPLVTTHTG